MNQTGQRRIWPDAADVAQNGGIALSLPPSLQFLGRRDCRVVVAQGGGDDAGQMPGFLSIPQAQIGGADKSVFGAQFTQRVGGDARDGIA